MAGYGAAVAVGWAADRAFGEPPTRWHPVAWFGTFMATVERRTYRPTRAAGVGHVAIGIAVAAGTGVLAERLLGRRLAVAVATAVAVGGRMLGDEVQAVGALVARGDLDAARRRVGGLVGRRTEEMDADEIVRAAVESLAENTVDAVVAPLCWAAIGGAPGVLVHRAVNTLDAMVGHRSERYEHFGWAAARLDDVVNYVPARLSAAVMALLQPHRAHAVWRAVHEDAPAHPSPNGGVIEAAMAAALGIRLGGTNHYVERTEHRGVLGDGRPPVAADVPRAVRLATAVGVVVALAVASRVAVSWRRRGRR